MEMDEATAARFTDDARKRFEAMLAEQEKALEYIDRRIPQLDYLIEIDRVLGQAQMALDDLVDELEDSGLSGEEPELLTAEVEDGLQRVVTGRAEMQRRISILRNGGEI
jgi:hypothetical protein